MDQMPCLSKKKSSVEQQHQVSKILGPPLTRETTG